jgi:hypothetical protein
LLHQSMFGRGGDDANRFGFGGHQVYRKRAKNIGA